MAKFVEEKANKPKVQEYLIRRVLPIIEQDFIKAKQDLFGKNPSVDLTRTKASFSECLDQEKVTIPIKGQRGFWGLFGVSQKTGEIRFVQRSLRGDEYVLYGSLPRGAPDYQNELRNKVSLSVSSLFGLAQKTIVTSANIHSEGETNAQQWKRKEGDLALETRFIERTNAVSTQMVATLSKKFG